MFLLRYWRRTGEPHALEMVERTLRAMRHSAIWDAKRGGFHRYAVDAEWKEPHFEKMLCDQALLAMAYLETYQATQKSEYAATARAIFTYVLRDLRAPNGAFYSANDSESLLVRPRETGDGAVPSGNSVQLMNLVRLSRITGNPLYDKAANDLLRTSADDVTFIPSASAHLISGLDFLLGPSFEVVLA